MFACASENEPEGGDHARKRATLSTFVGPCKRTNRDRHREHTRRREEKRESARARGIILKVVLPTPHRHEQESHAPDQGRPDSDFDRNMPDRTKNATAGNEGLRGWQGRSKSIIRRSSFGLSRHVVKLLLYENILDTQRSEPPRQGVCECLRRLNESRVWSATTSTRQRQYVKSSVHFVENLKIDSAPTPRPTTRPRTRQVGGKAHTTKNEQMNGRTALYRTLDLGTWCSGRKSCLLILGIRARVPQG